MKSLFQPETLQEILTRISHLVPKSRRQWGIMEVEQMFAHCTAALETATGKVNLPRIFIGRILGPLVKGTFSGTKPFGKNSPTAKSFIINDKKDFEKEKENLIKIIKQFSEGGVSKCTTHPHSFFGKLTQEHWGIGMYKHLDHHFRQFGV